MDHKIAYGWYAQTFTKMTNILGTDITQHANTGWDITEKVVEIYKLLICVHTMKILLTGNELL